mgnify:CR=1 FL=1
MYEKKNFDWFRQIRISKRVIPTFARQSNIMNRNIYSLGAALLMALAACQSPAEAPAAETTQPTPAMSTPAAPPQGGFSHVVYFYLREGLTQAEIDAFIEQVRTLSTIETVRYFQIGVPAGTPRDVVDNSYGVALIEFFDDKEGHDIYQDHPTHLAFIEANKDTWTSVKVYDSIPR